MGQQFFWPQFMWGYIATLACFATFMGKWLRRSSVMTGAEWMVIRFGDGRAGEFARTAYAVMAVVIAVAFIGFAEYGCSQFLAIFVDRPAWLPYGWAWDKWPHLLAMALMAATSIYAIASGLIGVGITGFLQFFIVLTGSGILIWKAISLGSHEQIAAVVPAEWFNFWPEGKWLRLGEWELTTGWIWLAPVALTWVVKGVALGVGGPQQLYDLQRFLAARTPREASLAGMIWGVGLAPMFMVSAAVGVIGLVQWGGQIENPEQLYPVVIGSMLPVGVKGLVLAGVLSAFMSTFSATVNAGASYLSHDLYRKFMRPDASDDQLVRASRVASLVIVVAGVGVGMAAPDINAVFEWIMMVLGTAVLIPSVLRWFWWRFNGVGFAVGTLAGVAASISWAILVPSAESYVTFSALLGVSLVSSVGSALLTPPTDNDVLAEFYRRVRPAGFWGPVRRAAQHASALDPSEPFGWDLISTVITAIGLQALFLASTYAVTHQWNALFISLAIAAISSFILYFTWYLKLPCDEPRAEKRASIAR
jgi:Na+/proline symporter